MINGIKQISILLAPPGEILNRNKLFMVQQDGLLNLI